MILGMFPFNDDHIIKVIRERIDQIIYYYYPSKNSDSEKLNMELIFPDQTIEFHNVVDLWRSFE